MDRDHSKQRLQGCYTTIPTMFHDADLELNLTAMQRHVRFLRAGGLREGTGVLLSGGGAGDFSTLTVEERLRVAAAVIEAAEGQIPVAVGVQTTSTRELAQLSHAAAELGADYLQVSPPFYFSPTEDDFFEYLAAASVAAPDVGLIVYNTYWTSMGVSDGMVSRLLDLPNVVGLKWSSPDGAFFGFERVVYEYADRLSVIDNQLRFVTSHMLGARSIELHIANHWPQWGVRLWEQLEAGAYADVQQQMMQVVMPFYQLWAEMERYTSGDGYLDKLCMELVGLDSSRCRPPTRDVRARFRDQVRQMLLQCGTPNVVD